jgi:PEP-CTERM motif
MNITQLVTRSARTAALTLALGLAGAAQASIVNYTFSVTIDFSAAPEVALNDVFHGSFSYDDSSFTEDPINFPGERFYALQSFSFSFNNVSFGLPDVTGDAVTQGGSFAGLDVGGPGFSFIPDASGPYFAFDINGRSGTGLVNNTLLVQQVPEPGALALSALALGLLGLRRR